MKKSRKPNYFDFASEVGSFFKSVDLGLIPNKTNPSMFFSSSWWGDSRTNNFLLNGSIPENLREKIVVGFCGQTDEDRFFDQKVLERLYQEDHNFFLKKVRFYRTFLQDSFFQSLISLGKASDSNLAYQIQQFQLIREQEVVSSRTFEKARKEIEKLDWLELISYLTIWWEHETAEEIKQPHHQIRSNAPYLEGVFSLAINCKLKSGGTKPDWKDPEVLMTGFLRHLDNVRNSKKWGDFLEVIDKLKFYLNWQGFVDDFCYRGHRILFLEDGMISTLPESSDAEIKWQIINEQNRLLEDYFSRIGKEMLPPQERGVPGLLEPLNPGNQVRMQLLGLPEDVRLYEREVNINKLTLFLSGLQAFHRERYVRVFGEILLEKPDSKVFDLINEANHRTNLWPKPMMGPLNITNIDYMVDRIFGKIGFNVNLDRAGIRAGIRALSLDVLNCNSHFEFNLSTHPFISIGEIVIYLSRHISLHNPSVLVQNRMFKVLEKQKNTRGTFGSGLEKTVKAFFVRSGFEVVKADETEEEEIKLYNAEGRGITGIDVLVRKGNEILVLQIKNTYYRLGTKSIVEYRETHEKAGHQLDLAIAHIIENREAFLKRFSLPINPKDLKVYGLIVSSTQEDSYESFGLGKFPKVSIYELDILLHNSKPFIVNWEFEALAFDLNSRKAAHEKFLSLLSAEVAQGEAYLLEAAKIRQEAKLNDLMETLDAWEGKVPTIERLLECVDSDWIWRDLIRLNPIDCPSDNAPIHVRDAFREYQSGMHFFKIKEFKNALPHFQKAWKLNPSDPEYLQMIGDSLAYGGELKQAIKTYDDLISQFPENKFGYENRAMTNLELDDLESALIDFEKLVSLDPENHIAFLHKEGIRNHIGKEQLSLEVIQRVGQYASIHPEIWAHYFYKKILPELKVLEQKEKKGKEDYRLLSKGYFLLNAYPFALKYLNKLLELDPNDVNALYDRGWFKLKNGLNDSAAMDFRKVIELDPSNYSAWDLIGSIEKESKNFELAELAYKRAIELNPTFARTIFNLGILYKENQRNDEAEKLFQKVKDDKEFGIGSMMHLGDIFRGRDDFSSARQFYKNAVLLGYNPGVKKYLELASS
jgi:tetratricopeptide (TPR) repeat protein